MVMRLRANTNLKLLENAARKLGDINDRVAYVGGCATAMLLNDPVSLDVRQTQDVDCIIDIASLPGYYKLENELRKLGFAQSMHDEIRCRWRYNDIILDVMPTEENVLGFGNIWYPEALRNAAVYSIADDLNVNAITAPYFLATKIEAFKSRGENDMLMSHDFEDIIAVVAGRNEIVEDIARSNAPLNEYLRAFFSGLLRDDQFEQILPGNLNDGPATQYRVQAVITRIKSILA